MSQIKNSFLWISNMNEMNMFSSMNHGIPLQILFLQMSRIIHNNQISLYSMNTTKKRGILRHRTVNAESR